MSWVTQSSVAPCQSRRARCSNALRRSAIEPAERLVEDDQAGPCSGQGPAEPDALALAPREESATLAQGRLEPLRQAAEDLEQIGPLQSWAEPRRGMSPVDRKGGSQPASDSRAAPPDRPRLSCPAAIPAVRRRAAHRRRRPDRPRPGASPAGARPGSISRHPKGRRSPRDCRPRSQGRFRAGSSVRPRGTETPSKAMTTPSGSCRPRSSGRLPSSLGVRVLLAVPRVARGDEGSRSGGSGIAGPAVRSPRRGSEYSAPSTPAAAPPPAPRLIGVPQQEPAGQAESEQELASLDRPRPSRAAADWPGPTRRAGPRARDGPTSRRNGPGPRRARAGRRGRSGSRPPRGSGPAGRAPGSRG